MALNIKMIPFIETALRNQIIDYGIINNPPDWYNNIFPINRDLWWKVDNVYTTDLIFIAQQIFIDTDTQKKFRIYVQRGMNGNLGTLHAFVDFYVLNFNFENIILNNDGTVEFDLEYDYSSFDNYITEDSVNNLNINVKHLFNNEIIIEEEYTSGTSFGQSLWGVESVHIKLPAQMEQISNDYFYFSTHLVSTPSLAPDIRWNSIFNVGFKINNLSPIGVTSVVVEPNEEEILINEETNLSAVVYPSNATDKTIGWLASNDVIVKIEPNGNNCKVIGLNSGESYVFAISNYDNSIRGYSTINVKEILPESITAIPNNITMEIENEEIINIIILPENTTNKNYTVNLSDDTIISYEKNNNNNIIINALKEGSTTMLLQLESDPTKTAIISITVIPKKPNEYYPLAYRELNNSKNYKSFNDLPYKTTGIRKGNYILELNAMNLDEQNENEKGNIQYRKSNVLKQVPLIETRT